jgi:tRNA threonylcarbamoyladenosine biosynthesis protein TsaE
LGSSFYQITVSLSFPVKLPDAAATISLGREIGLIAKAGEVIALVGDLGAGKTTLTQGILEGLGYEQEVTSPTFSLVQEYLGGRLEVFHFDFYRVEEEHELLDLGWDDYLDRQGLVIVEWPTLHSDLLPKHTCWLKLSHIEGGRLVESR